MPTPNHSQPPQQSHELISPEEEAQFAYTGNRVSDAMRLNAMSALQEERERSIQTHRAQQLIEAAQTEHKPARCTEIDYRPNLACVTDQLIEAFSLPYIENIRYSQGGKKYFVGERVVQRHFEYETEKIKVKDPSGKRRISTLGLTRKKVQTQRVSEAHLVETPVWRFDTLDARGDRMPAGKTPFLNEIELRKHLDALKNLAPQDRVDWIGYEPETYAEAGQAAKKAEVTAVPPTYEPTSVHAREASDIGRERIDVAAWGDYEASAKVARGLGIIWTKRRFIRKQEPTLIDWHKNQTTIKPIPKKIKKRRPYEAFYGGLKPVAGLAASDFSGDFNYHGPTYRQLIRKDGYKAAGNSFLGLTFDRQGSTPETQAIPRTYQVVGARKFKIGRDLRIEYTVAIYNNPREEESHHEHEHPDTDPIVGTYTLSEVKSFVIPESSEDTSQDNPVNNFTLFLEQVIEGEADTHGGHGHGHAHGHGSNRGADQTKKILATNLRWEIPYINNTSAATAHSRVSFKKSLDPSSARLNLTAEDQSEPVPGTVQNVDATKTEVAVGTQPNTKNNQTLQNPRDFFGSMLWRDGDNDRPVYVTGYAGKGADGREYVYIKGTEAKVPADELRTLTKRSRYL